REAPGRSAPHRRDQRWHAILSGIRGTAMDRHVRVIDHPLIQHKLTGMRRKETSSPEFRNLLREISLLMAYEVLRDRPPELVEIERPVAHMKAPVIAGRMICLVSILRAGNGLLDGMLEIVPGARVGHIGLYRDPATLAAVEYYCKLPVDVS